MIAVAVVAVGLGTAGVIRRAIDFRAKAARHARMRAQCLECVETFVRAAQSHSEMLDSIRPPFGEPEMVESSRTQEEWEREAVRQLELKIKYERAARYPWLPVAPDPSLPE